MRLTSDALIDNPSSTWLRDLSCLRKTGSGRRAINDFSFTQCAAIRKTASYVKWGIVSTSNGTTGHEIPSETRERRSGDDHYEMELDHFKQTLVTTMAGPEITGE
jgi:hypothetical protein